MKSQIRGAVRWQKTALARAQKGTEYATAHVTDIRKKKMEYAHKYPSCQIPYGSFH